MQRQYLWNTDPEKAISSHFLNLIRCVQFLCERVTTAQGEKKQSDYCQNLKKGEKKENLFHLYTFTFLSK